MSIEFISYSFVVSLSVPKLCTFEKSSGSNTFATDGRHQQASFRLHAIEGFKKLPCFH